MSSLVDTLDSPQSYVSVLEVERAFEQVVAEEADFFAILLNKSDRWARRHAAGLAKGIISDWGRYDSLESENVNHAHAEARAYGLSQWLAGLMTTDELKNWYSPEMHVKLTLEQRDDARKHMTRYMRDGEIH